MQGEGEIKWHLEKPLHWQLSAKVGLLCPSLPPSPHMLCPVLHPGTQLPRSSVWAKFVPQFQLMTALGKVQGRDPQNCNTEMNW